MKNIKDLKKNYKINILYDQGVNHLDFSSSILDVNIKQKYIQIEPIRYQNKLISFEGFPMDLQVNFPNESPYKFKKVMIKNIEGKTFIFLDKKTAYANNRRCEARIYVGKSIDITFNENSGNIHNGMLYDVSKHGFSVVVDKNKLKLYTTDKIKQVSFSYTEVVMNARKMTLRLTGKVVRIQEKGEKCIIGCRIIYYATPDLDEYIKAKQNISI